MGGQDAVLIGGACPAHQFEGTEIGGEEAEAGDPGRHLAPGHEVILAGIGLPLQIEADRQHQREVENYDD